MSKLELAAQAEILLNENPSWPYEKVINKIKEMMDHGAKTNDTAN